VLVDGKTRNLQNRKFCLDCSPFGKHNTRASFDPVAEKPCLNCGGSRNRGATLYCSNQCQADHQHNEYISRWQQGLETGIGTEWGSVSQYVRRYLLSRANNRCEECDWDKLNPVSGKCPLEIHHIDGDSRNCSEENLVILCPNCHALTPTYRNFNKGRGRNSLGFRR
jgi:hypothetical protein